MNTKKHEKHENKFSCVFCDFSCSRQTDWDRHIIRPKHVSGIQNDTKKHEKNTSKFACDICDFSCSRQSEWNRHIIRPKHLSGIQSNKKTQDKNTDYTCSNCNKSYKYHSGLWKHAKTCKIEFVDEKEKQSDTSSSEIKVLTDLILEMVKSNSELQKQVLDVCKNSNTTNNIHTNSHNKTFNLQFFLNEQCKDAMNISEFVSSFDLQLSDLESVGELGYVEGITKQIVDKLNSMDIYKRPVHCSDAKRETMYVKDEDRWEKEERNNPKLRQAIKTISFNNMKLVGKWSDTYPESKSSESRLNDKYMKLVKQTTGGNGEISDNEDKIIRRIAKEIIIDKA
jgi:hypothetical protein